MLQKVFICPSNLPYATLVLIVKKLEEGFQVCVDYCALNALTIKNQNIFLLILETLPAFFQTKFTASLTLLQLSMKYVYEKEIRKK